MPALHPFDDPFSFVLGIESEDDQRAREDKKQKYAEAAAQVVQMMEKEGWKHLLAELDRLEKMHSCEPAVYSENPKLAHIHTGILHAISFIRTWTTQCQVFVKEKEYEQRS